MSFILIKGRGETQLQKTHNMSFTKTTDICHPKFTTILYKPTHCTVSFKWCLLILPSHPACIGAKHQCVLLIGSSQNTSPSKAVHSLFISAREPNNWFWERRLRGGRERESDSECCLEGLLLSYILTTRGGRGCKLHYPHTRNTVTCLCSSGSLHTLQSTVVTVCSASF